MSFNGSGVFALNQNFPADEAAGPPDSLISSAKMDDEFRNFKAGLESCLVRDGQNAMTGNLPMGGKKITGLGSGTAATDALARGQAAGDGLEFNADTLRVKLDGTSLTRASSGLSVTAPFLVGMVLPYVGATAPTGWVLCDDGTIGDTESGATNRNEDDTEALFAMLWESFSDTVCPVSSGRGVSAAADFAAHKTIALPPMSGRVLGAAGSGTDLTARAAGAKVGEETHTMTEAEIFPHTHALPFGNEGTGSQSSGNGRLETTSSASELCRRSTVDTTYQFTGLEVVGSGTPFNVMQPTLFINHIIKL